MIQSGYFMYFYDSVGNLFKLHIGQSDRDSTGQKYQRQVNNERGIIQRHDEKTGVVV